MRLAAAAAATAAAAAAAAYLYLRRRRAPPLRKRRSSRSGSDFPSGSETFDNAVLAESSSVALSGTLLLCTQNLAVSGANQVLLNLVEGGVWSGSIALLSPSLGPFAKEFSDLGVAVHIGQIGQLLARVRDVRLAVCNTIMTAHLVLKLSERGIPAVWILHEWWPPEMMVEELGKRNDKNTTPDVVAAALAACPRTVCVCRSQLELYKPASGSAVFVGVPSPKANWKAESYSAKLESLGGGGGGGGDPVAKLLGGGSRDGSPPLATGKRPLTFLCLGIVCPRKNQLWTAEVFLEWAGTRTDVRLLVVGARYQRQYEIEYVEKVKALAAGDPRVEVHDVTNDVDKYYSQADVMLFASLNEVTPMVLAEAMIRQIPVITTDIAGIPEMLTHKTHGFVLPPEKPAFIGALHALGGADADSQRRRVQMGVAARKHAEATFTNELMIANYRALTLALSAPVVLLDMDGVVVDWDAGFLAAWGGRSAVDRSHYAMEQCVPAARYAEAQKLFHSKGFFRDLPPRDGAIAAVKAMAARGYQVRFCTSPILTSEHCASEKYAWVRHHFGDAWVSRIVMCADKTLVRGDVLIDDKPHVTGSNAPTWQHLLYDAPYNRDVDAPRLSRWADWEDALTAILTTAVDTAPSDAKSVADSDEGGVVTSDMVAALPDFSHLLPADYRMDYSAWRLGKPQGAKGELWEAMEKLNAVQDEMLNRGADDFTEVVVFRKGYANWRRGGVAGAKGIITQL